MPEGRVVQLSTQRCRIDPCFVLISNPGRVTLSRRVTVALGKSSNHHCTLQTNTQAALIGQNPKPKLGLPGTIQL